jgi:hypothetical protein
VPSLPNTLGLSEPSTQNKVKKAALPYAGILLVYRGRKDYPRVKEDKSKKSTRSFFQYLEDDFLRLVPEIRVHHV